MVTTTYPLIFNNIGIESIWNLIDCTDLENIIPSQSSSDVNATMGKARPIKDNKGAKHAYKAYNRKRFIWNDFGATLLKQKCKRVLILKIRLSDNDVKYSCFEIFLKLVFIL